MKQSRGTSGFTLFAALTALFVMSFSLWGCASSPKVGLNPDDSTATAANEPLVLEVENHNWSDVNIYIEYNSRTERLGMVTAARDAEIVIPKTYQGDQGIFRLIVVRIGGTDVYRTPSISSKTGRTVRLTVESDLARSSVGVW